MDRATEAVVGLSAALAADVSHWPAALDAASAYSDARAVEESLLQTYLFLGFPVAIQALTAWRKRAGSVNGQVVEDADENEWRLRGETVCGAVYGDKYEQLRVNIAALHPDLDRWMIVDGYGKVLGRPGLDLRTRELCVVAILAGIHAPKQLHAHLRGALNSGATPDDIDFTLELAGAVQGPARRAAAARVWYQVRTLHTDGAD